MKRYIYKTILFLSPILILFILTEIYYKTNQGDLTRLGFVYDNGSYRKEISPRIKNIQIKYKELSSINSEAKNEFTVLTIGDSFSEKGKIGYNNYLANQDSLEVLHYNGDVYGNPIQTLFSIVNGDFFDRIDVKFVVLQSVERSFVDRSLKINKEAQLKLESILKQFQKKEVEEGGSSSYTLFSDKIFKIPFVNISYYFTDNPKYSKTFKTETKTPLFTNKYNSLLFYEGDLKKIEVNNDSSKVKVLNETLNDLNDLLSNKGVKLIVLPSPDKYDIYYEDIVNKNNYIKPLFFDYLNDCKKSYLYLNTKKLLTKMKNKTKDVYYYDDTHWSPITAEIVGVELSKMIKNQKQ